MQWTYKNISLKEYLYSILKNKDDLTYLYSTVRRILKKEYDSTENIDMLIEDILNRDKIQRIIRGEYKKQESKSWNFKGELLKTYLYNIIYNKNDLDYLYHKIKVILEREYILGEDLDSHIENILARDDIKKIIAGTYKKKEDTAWIYKGIPLMTYIELNIKSEHHTSSQIRKNIESYVSKRLTKENLDISKRAEIIEEYLQSNQFQKFLVEGSKERQEYFYNGEKLRAYLKRNIQDENNLDYIYQKIIAKVSHMHSLDPKKDLESIIDSVIHDKNILNEENITKVEREEWPYQDGLLIDYLKTIDLKDKKLITVYIQVKDFINRKYPDGFHSLEEKKKAIEDYVQSDMFSKYLKYGYINKKYFYKGMPLVRYLEQNYKEELMKSNKTVENLYYKIKRILNEYPDIDTLSLEQIEDLIEIILNSDEIKIYLNQVKIDHENWSYQGENLKDILSRIYSEIICDEDDLYKIYSSIVYNARVMKKKHPEISNENIINSLLNPSFISDFKEKYQLRKLLKKEVKIKQELYDNKDDLAYIKLYCLENKLDINDVINIAKKGFNYYSAIIMLEYSIKFGENIEELIDFTLNGDESDNNYLLWMFKLGFKNYEAILVQKNKGLIYLLIQEFTYKILDNNININIEEIFSFLNELLLKKHIAITVSKDYLFYSFKSFITSCIKIYLFQIRKDDKYKYVPFNDNIDSTFIFESKIEDEYILLDQSQILMNEISKLSE